MPPERKENAMAAQRTSFEKLQRDRAKKAKAAAKREKRLERSSGEAEAPEERPQDEPGTELSAAELLRRVEELHNAFEAKKISFEDFEEQKADLMSRIPVD
jgi:ATPase subunit of ABC transporter with duplicated ATPase domains